MFKQRHRDEGCKTHAGSYSIALQGHQRSGCGDGRHMLPLLPLDGVVVRPVDAYCTRQRYEGMMATRHRFLRKYYQGSKGRGGYFSR
jgi:hypothetical protein